MSKIAPHLSALVEVEGARYAMAGVVRAQLRALLHCAKTLEALHAAMEEPPSALVACWRDSAGRALARLSRASGKGGGR